MLLAPSFLLSRKEESRRSLFRHALDGLVLLHGFLPIAAIEFLDDHTPHSALIQTVWGDSWGKWHRERGPQYECDQVLYWLLDKPTPASVTGLHVSLQGPVYFACL